MTKIKQCYGCIITRYMYVHNMLQCITDMGVIGSVALK